MTSTAAPTATERQSPLPLPISASPGRLLDAAEVTRQVIDLAAHGTVSGPVKVEDGELQRVGQRDRNERRSVAAVVSSGSCKQVVWIGTEVEAGHVADEYDPAPTPLAFQHEWGEPHGRLPEGVGDERRIGVEADHVLGERLQRGGLGEIGLPVFARAVTPAGPYKFGPGRIGMPVAISGVLVEAGGLFVADDGVVVVRSEEADEVVTRAEKIEAGERRKRTSIGETAGARV